MSSKEYGKVQSMKEDLLERVEIIVANGDIACYEQFLLLSQCFQNVSAGWKGSRCFSMS